MDFINIASTIDLQETQKGIDFIMHFSDNIVHIHIMGIIKYYLLNSSLHGFYFIVNEKFHWTERLFWTICVIASWCASLALMYNSLQEYESQRTSFFIDTSYLHWETNFPSIVICEILTNNKTIQANNKLFSDNLDQIPKLEKFIFFDGTMQLKEKSCQVGGKYRSKCLMGNYSAYMKKYRSTCPEIIGACYYNNEELSCCDEFLPIKTYHGPCFAFNSLVSGKYSTRNDLQYKIIRNVNFGYGNLSIELFHTNFIIYALSQSEVPAKDSAFKYALLKSSHSLLKSDVVYNTFISLKETFTEETTKIVSIDNRGCRFDDENNLHHSDIYSLSACDNECRANAQMKICGCILHTLPHKDERNDCNFDGIVCTMYNDSVISEIVKTCKCVSSCFEAEIDNIGFTISKKSKRFEDLKSVMRINFIVKPPHIRYTRGVVKDPLSRIVSVGGTVGLFIGASLLTIVEILYYFIIRQLGNKYLKRNRNRKNTMRNLKQKDCSFCGCQFRKKSVHFEFVN